MEPIYTKGNAFWRGNERFLIKGISYIPQYRGNEVQQNADFLAEDHLHNLKRDIEIFRELGLNTIQVSKLNPSNSHKKALEMLNEAGIYVLVELFEDIRAPSTPPKRGNRFETDFDTAPYYPSHMLKTALRIVDEVMSYPNVLSFMVSGDAIQLPGLSKIAEVSRAAVGDVKKFLRMRGGRIVPVGVRVNDISALELCMLQYFTAGTKEERADFFAPERWSWVHQSSFQISGWMAMAHAFSKYPVPMFLGAYGANVSGTRIWREIECLYSSDMTSVFSGGLIYTYFEHDDKYGIVKIREDSTVEKKPEFEFLKRRFNKVNMHKTEDMYSSDVKDYESWTGEFPWIRKNRWYAGWHIPYFSGKWEGLLEEVEDAKEWVLIDKLVLSESSE